jgi:hypothetical protein
VAAACAIYGVLAPHSALTARPAGVHQEKNISTGDAHRPANIGSIDQLETFVVRLAKLAIPNEYENRKHWGRQKSIPLGFRITRDNGWIRAHTRKKKVNHGSWYRYRITLKDPTRLVLKLQNVKQDDNGNFTFSLFAEAPVAIFARHAQWQWGAQLWSIHADVDAVVQFRADCSVQININPIRIPPDIQLVPKVHSAEVQLRSFKIRRVSQLGRDVTQPFSKIIRSLIEDELEDRRGELPAKLNRQIDKNQDKLRLSLHDIMQSRWKSLIHGAQGSESLP